MSESKDLNAEHARTAAQIDADVNVEGIADVYAEGLLGATEGAGQTEAVAAEFDELVSEVLDKHPRLEAVLGSALISPEEKVGIIDRVFGKAASPTLVHFLKVVARHGRLDCLRAIHRQVRSQYDQLRGRVRIQLTTASPVPGPLAESLTTQLSGIVGGEPVVQWATDPRMIGGLVVRIGDTVYDGSVANQLHVLGQQMIDRSVHEIQSRRDRFRNPEGS